MKHFVFFAVIISALFINCSLNVSAQKPKKNSAFETAYTEARGERLFDETELKKVNKKRRRKGLSSYSGMESGQGYIDLGLPSGTKWADCNIGASSPTDSGAKFAWGETVTKEKFTKGNYKWRMGYSRNGLYSILDHQDDPACKLWGGAWRMPSKEQFEELITHTEQEFVVLNDVELVVKFKGTNGNSIFLPLLYSETKRLFGQPYGTYWTRNRHYYLMFEPNQEYYLPNFVKNVLNNYYLRVEDNHGACYDGLYVRPVHP